MSTVINNPFALYAGYMSELVSLYGRPLAPHSLAEISAEEVMTAIEEIDTSSIRYTPITPLQRLSVNGAMPVRSGIGWEAPMREVDALIKGYMNRSAPFMAEGKPPSVVQEILLSNETDFVSAIDHIHDKGDSFIGVGTLLPFIYAGWQNAAHAYIINSDPDIPRIFTPLYGALLCMARDRTEFLSLLSGNPIPDGDGWRPEGDLTPAELFKAVKALPEDRTFESVITGTIMRAIAGRSPGSWADHVRDFTENWFTQLRWAFYDGAPEIESQDSSLWPLIQRDSEGRGGPLVSEESFQRQRRLFLEGRVTGVSSGVTDFGISIVGDDMIENGRRPRVIYLSNVEDELFQELVLDNAQSRTPGELDISAKLVVLYSDIKSLNFDSDMLLISAKGLYPTVVDDAIEYARAAYALETPAGKRDEAYKSMYYLRLAVAMAKHSTSGEKRFPLNARLNAVMNDEDIGQKLQKILAHVKSVFHGNPVSFSHLRRMLKTESIEFKKQLNDSEKDLFLYNMVVLGIARMPGDVVQEMIIPS